MNIETKSDVTATAIAANLAALSRSLTQAAAMAAEGCARIQQGERDGAIGAVLDMDSILEEAKAIYVAIVALHRSRSI